MVCIFWNNNKKYKYVANLIGTLVKLLLVKYGFSMKYHCTMLTSHYLGPNYIRFLNKQFAVSDRKVQSRSMGNIAIWSIKPSYL